MAKKILSMFSWGLHIDMETWQGRGGGGGSQHLFTVLCESDMCPLENEVPWKVQSQSSPEAGC